MAAILAIDIGNSRISLGLFKGDSLENTISLPTADTSEAAAQMNFLDQEIGFDLISVSSVVPEAKAALLEAWAKIDKAKPIFEMHAAAQSIIRALYEGIGSDRAANAIAAQKLHMEGSDAVLVIDFGTATTMTAVSSKGEFLGGLIALGLPKTLRALKSSTAQLPHVEMEKLKTGGGLLAFNTEKAIENGCLHGHIGMVEHWIKLARKELPPRLKVVATGGMAPFIGTAIEGIDSIDEHLTLKGIRLAAEAGAVPADRD